MKKVNFVFLTALTVCSLSVVTRTLQATDIYLQNIYGAGIYYKIANEKEKMLGNGARIKIGSDITNLPATQIKTTSYMSPYYDLDYYLAQIKAQKRNHFDSKDAIINIGSSYGRWHITVEWEEASELERLSPEKEAEIKLEAIKNGWLGQEYADKAGAICSANYTVAKSKGLINLCERLKRILVEVELRKDTRVKSPAPNLKPTENEIKTNIDQLYKTLESYLAKGNASQAQ